jgi:hypothetical protein
MSWWAPKPLQRLHDRIGLRENGDRARVVPRPGTSEA